MTDRESPAGLEAIAVQALARLGPNRRIVGQAREYRIHMDVGRARGGEDSGPSPPECLTVALAGCVLNLARIWAEQRGLATGSLAVSVTGSIDPARAFGLESRNRAGFLDLCVQVDGVVDWPPSERSTLLQVLKERCPLCDNLANPTEVRFLIGPESDLTATKEDAT